MSDGERRAPVEAETLEALRLMASGKHGWALEHVAKAILATWGAVQPMEWSGGRDAFRAALAAHPEVLAQGPEGLAVELSEEGEDFGTETTEEPQGAMRGGEVGESDGEAGRIASGGGEQGLFDDFEVGSEVEKREGGGNRAGDHAGTSRHDAEA